MNIADLARQSTAIVQGTVSGSKGLLRGSDVFTVYSVQVSESWKMAAEPKSSSGRISSGKLSAGQALEVAVPGGVAEGIRQVVDGAPKLETGEEYVLFLWTGKSGLTQLTGLSQGVFRVERGGGPAMALRAAIAEPMLDASGRAVTETAVRMPAAELKSQVAAALAGGKTGGKPDAVKTSQAKGKQ
jgi:hypothetical protein